MSRSMLARSLEPLVAVSWGIFLVWSVWMAAVWILDIDREFLKLPIDQTAGWSQEARIFVEEPPAPPPPYADLRRAVLVLAENAELAWLALALIQLHLLVVSLNGVNTARTWVAIIIGGAFLLGSINRAFGIPFGWMYFTRAFGAQFFGVPLGWLLWWTVLLIASREAVLAIRPRAGHLMLTSLSAVVVLATMFNINPVAEHLRDWWGWHTGSLRQLAPAPWWSWLSWYICPWILLFLLREKTVAAAAQSRSAKPVVILAVLNIAALAANLLRLRLPA